MGSERDMAGKIRVMTERRIIPHRQSNGTCQGEKENRLWFVDGLAVASDVSINMPPKAKSARPLSSPFYSTSRTREEGKRNRNGKKKNHSCCNYHKFPEQRDKAGKLQSSDAKEESKVV